MYQVSKLRLMHTSQELYYRQISTVHIAPIFTHELIENKVFEPLLKTSAHLYSIAIHPIMKER